jgi:eukaryotic-like serine/threonine-protein kinase
MKKYILSPLYKLIALENDISNANIGLQNTLDNDILSLNNEIGFFIQLYQTPQYFTEVVNQFALKYEAIASEVQPIILNFFDALISRGILLTEKEALHIATLKFEPPTRAGENLNGYVLEKRLSFTMPVDIYRACNNEGKNFLVKILTIPPNAKKEDIRFWQRCFCNEFDILKQLSDDSKIKGISRLITFDKKEGIGVSTFFDKSQSLRKIIEEGTKKLKTDEKILIFKQLVSTLASIHKKNVIHGDLHTSNILINDKLELCLIDFDLAIISDKKKNKDLAWGGAIEFIPPENINENAFEKIKSYPTFLSELFQLGVVGYFLFYEKLPFEGRTWTELAQAIKHHNPNFESDTIPLSIQAFLIQIMSKNPVERRVDLGLINF